MIVLALETATSCSSVAILQNDELLGYVECDSSRSLTTQIIPAIHELLEVASLKMTNLEGLAVSIGPGTFTGLRVGLATMTAFRLALGIPLVGVPTLEGLAWNLPTEELPIMCTVAIRADMVYWSRFRWQKQTLVRLTPDQIGTLGQISEELTEPTVLLGDGWLRNKERLSAQNFPIVETPSKAVWPSAKSVGQAGKKLLEEGRYLPEGCAPRYIQPSYAKTSESFSQDPNASKTL